MDNFYHTIYHFFTREWASIILMSFPCTYLCCCWCWKSYERGIISKWNYQDFHFWDDGTYTASSSEMVWKMDVSLATELQCSLIKNKEKCMSRMPLSLSNLAQTVWGLYSQLSQKLVRNFILLSYLNFAFKPSTVRQPVSQEGWEREN